MDMDKDKFTRIVNELQNNINQLRALADIEVISPPTSTKKTKKSKKQKTDLETPIRELLNGDFFSDWKTDNDVIKELRTQVLIPKRASVSNVLRRLASSKRGLLERDGDGTKKSPWRYKEKL